MTNLLDIMRASGGGHGFERLSRQFGVTEVEIQRALSAILPAFSLGLNQALYDPARLGSLVDLMISGRYAPFFDGTSFEPGGGTDALLRVFGSPENTQRVAEQGAQLAGIGADLMTRMMPLVAATLVGGLFRHASLEGIGDLLRQWSDAFHRAHAAAGKPERRQAVRTASPATMANPFEWWSSLLLGPEAKAEPPRPTDPVVSAIDAWGGMVSAMIGAPQAASAPRPEPRSPPPGGVNPMQVLARMFDAGREAQTQHLAAFSAILDGFARGGATGRT